MLIGLQKISQKYVCWNHSISEVVNSLLAKKLAITGLKEYDYSPYNFVEKMEEFESKKYRIKQFKNKMPLVYSVVASS